jgi:hypothetical protein
MKLVDCVVFQAKKRTSLQEVPRLLLLVQLALCQRAQSRMTVRREEREKG